MVERNRSSGREAAASSNKDKEDSVSLQGTQKITMFFKQNQKRESHPLEPRKQRAIPQVQQAEPRRSDSQHDSNDKKQKGLTGGGGASGSTAETGTAEERPSGSSNEKSKPILREDAVDVSLQAHAKEVADDIITNPVIQANKRALRNEKDCTFLECDSTSKSQLNSIQDEQIALFKEQGGGTEDPEIPDFEQEIEVEHASEEEDVVGPLTRSARRGRRMVDSDYNEDPDECPEQESDEDAPMDDLEAEQILDEPATTKKDKPVKKFSRRHRTEVDEAQLEGEEQEETVFIDNLPNEEQGIKSMLIQVRKTILDMEKQFLLEEDSDPEDDSRQLAILKRKKDGNQQELYDSDADQAPNYIHQKQFWCIPLSVNVTQFEFEKLNKAQMKHGGRLFDIITMDPPWQLSSANPTRGVAIAYDTLIDNKIEDIPFDLLQKDGFLFIWVINNKYRFALRLFARHGYKLVDEIVWIKQTINGKINKGHGYYLQHAKETCLIGYKGDLKDRQKINVDSDVIFSMRRGQSQKPEEIYEIAESLVPNGYYLEIFGRRNNLHDGWVTIGNEL